MEPLAIYRDLAREASALKFEAPAAYVYNPLDYAWAPFAQYLQRYGRGPKEALLLGMNPGPWGMAQTGIPFGEVASVRDWLGISGDVRRPQPEHPKRPVLGFDCPRSEVSGKRLWGWARARFQTPARFFSRFFVANYCPLAFMEESGKNLTPDKLPRETRAALETVCDKALRRFTESLRPRWVIGVGGFARKRAETALAGLDVRIGEILHPSPANPSANRGWEAKAEEALRGLGIAL